MAGKHSTTLTGTDDPDHDVSKDEWNADHLTPPFVIPFLMAQLTVTNLPAALTELGTTHRHRVKADLTNVTEVRTQVAVTTVAGSSGSILYIQGSTDGTSFTNFLDGSAGPTHAIDSTGLKVSSWTTLAAALKADIWLRIVTSGGNDTADPIICNVMMQCR